MKLAQCTRKRRILQVYHLRSIALQTWHRTASADTSQITAFFSYCPTCTLVTALALITSLPLYLFGLPEGLDQHHHYRVALGFYESIRGGNFYPSWLPSTTYGYGDVSVRFYPPVLYYVLSLCRFITGDWYFASLVAFTLLTLAGALGIYLWARELTTSRYAVIAAVAYTLTPFHNNELYSAGQYGQYIAGSVLPFIFLSVERIIRGSSWRAATGLGLSLALLILSHVPLTVMGTMAISVYILVRFTKSFSLASLYRLGAGALLGIAMSCFYWLPVMRELRWKYPSGMGQGEWFDYRNQFLFQMHSNEVSTFSLPLLTGAMALMAAPAVLLICKKTQNSLAPAAVAVMSFIMTTSLSKPLWDALPPLQETQFPWRWLAVTSVCLPVLTAMGMPEVVSLWRTRRRPVALVLFGAVVIGLSFTVLQVIGGATPQDYVTFSRRLNKLPVSKANIDFLPIWATDPPPMKTPAEVNNRSVSIVEWSAEKRVIWVAAGQEEDVRLRTFYYPYWTATAEGRRLPTRHAKDGALLVTVPSQTTTVTIQFAEPASTFIAGAVSILGLAAGALLLIMKPQQLARTRFVTYSSSFPVLSHYVATPPMSEQSDLPEHTY